MFQDSELFNAVHALVVLVFVLTQGRALKRLPKWALLFSAYSALFAGLVVTILEGMFWPNILNAAEHACYAFSALFFSLWCWRALPTTRKRS